MSPSGDTPGRRNRAYTGSARGRVPAVLGRWRRRRAAAPRVPGLLRNIPELENAAAGRGLFTIRPEPDGIVRRVPVVMLADGSKVPSLSVELLRVVSGAGAILIKMNEAGVQSVAFGRRGLEIAPIAWAALGSFQPARQIPLCSGEGCAVGAADPARFKGKIVLVGTSRSGFSTSRLHRWIRRCRASRSTPSSWKAC